jgi:hypothetical protein
VGDIIVATRAWTAARMYGERVTVEALVGDQPYIDGIKLTDVTPKDRG